MEPLSAALGRVLRLHNVPPLDPTDPEEIERNLLGKPLLPSGAYASELEYQRGIQHAREASDLDRRTASGEIARLERLLAAAELRDRLLRDRPAGCFCYGLGGMQKRWLQMPDGDPVPTWTIWCTCPEAIEQQAAKERLLVERRRQQLQKNAERLFGSLDERFRDFTFETLLAKAQALRVDGASHRKVIGLAEAWLNDPKKWALFLRGPTGVGKTGLAVSVLHQAIAEGRSALFVDVSDLLAELRDSFDSAETFAASDPSAHWHALFEIELLLIDDLGAERHKQGEVVDWATEQVWRLIGNRHRSQMKTIVTSNHSLAELTQIFGHARISSRLAEESLVVNCSDLPVLREP